VESAEKGRDTDSFKVPVRETGTVEIPQALGCPVQLLSRFNRKGRGESEATYQLQPVGMIALDVVHDVPMFHPL